MSWAVARMIPNEPVGPVKPEIAKIFQVIKRLPSDDYVAWFSLPLVDTSDRKPEFLVSYQGRACFLISVARVSQELADTVLQPHFLDSLEQETLTLDGFAKGEGEVLRLFEKTALKDLGIRPDETIPVQKLVVFPNVDEGTLEQVVVNQSPVGVRYLGREQLNSEMLADRLKAMATSHQDRQRADKFIHSLRQHFSPETQIPENFKPALVRRDRQLKPELTGYLMDYDQEWVVKNDLVLPEEAEQLVASLKPRLVTGVAGSGKSLVLIYRAMLLAKLHDSARSLVLTHNRPLRGDLSRRFRQLGSGAAIEWKTFYAWVYGLWQGDWKEPISRARREALIERLRERHGVGIQSFSIDFLLDEIDWIKDWGLVQQSDYLSAERRGRGVPLNQAMRRLIHRFFGAYQRELHAEGLTDWSGVALRFWKDVESGAAQLPAYDFICVDEAQFFAPVWLRVIQRCLKPGTGQLFLAADPTQGFLKRRQSWSVSGLDVRGRTTRLRKSYRNTKAILAFAAAFYRDRLGDEIEEEDLNLPDAEDLVDLPVGRAPHVILLTSTQDEVTRVVREVKALAEEDIQAEHMLVIPAQTDRSEILVRCLEGTLGQGCVADLRHTTPSAAQVRVCSLNACTGLESPVVFVLGIDTMIEREDSLELSSEERAELRRDNTRRLYMAFTRAGQRLVVTCRSEKTATWLKKFV